MGRVIYTVPLQKDKNGHLVRENRSFHFGTDYYLDRIDKYANSEEYKKNESQHRELMEDLKYAILLAKKSGNEKNAKLLEKYVNNLKKASGLNHRVIFYAKDAIKSLKDTGKVPLVIKAQMLLSCRSAQRVTRRLHSTNRKIHNIDKNLDEIVTIGGRYRKFCVAKELGISPYNKSFSWGEMDPIYEIERNSKKRINEIIEKESDTRSQGRRH